MGDEEHFTGPWLCGEIFDDSGSNNQSIVKMVFDYDLKSVGHLIMTNYTWRQTDIQKLITIYAGLDEILNSRLAEIQKYCEQAKFEKLLRKSSDLELPIYSKCVDLSTISPTSMGRVYHDPHEFLENGSASTTEVAAFVTAVLKKALGSIFRPAEIKKVVEAPTNLIETLMESDGRDSRIGVKSKKLGLDYELCHELRDRNPEDVFPDFVRKMPVSLTNFLVYFCLHTIRHACHVTFSPQDGRLRIHDRKSFEKAAEDAAKTTMTTKKQAIKRSIKMEKRESDDDDFCQIIEHISTTKKPKIIKTEVRQEEKIDSATGGAAVDLPEKKMLEELEKADISMVFKMKFRRLVDDNQMLRTEHANYQQLIDLKIAEKTNRFAGNR